MNYQAYLFFNHYNNVTTELRYIDGQEQVCLIIPTKINYIRKGSHGNWFSVLRFRACPPNAEMRTHIAGLNYPSKEAEDEAKSRGTYWRTQKIGRLYEVLEHPYRKFDRTNLSTDLICDGEITLSDIPEKCKVFNVDSSTTYVRNVTFKPYGNDNIIYTGSLEILDIPDEYIIKDPNTGKKKIRCRFCKLEALDNYMNTHHLIISLGDGSEIEIGRFREWVKTNPTASGVDAAPQEEHDTTVNQRQTPQSIDGIKF